MPPPEIANNSMKTLACHCSRVKVILQPKGREAELAAANSTPKKKTVFGTVICKSTLPFTGTEAMLFMPGIVEGTIALLPMKVSTPVPSSSIVTVMEAKPL